ncbi:MAG: tRNA (N6-threonylcarbamoyladenosine(37)-N6)-methyltransferase TrmO [Clostridia bacterium]|nr:tRNA (N6-threonylcarbamoyladenosine(37)-N6)-methyltransferase TrmO [Clostridia bacterium]
MELKIIAKIYNGFSEKFGIPRQSGMTDAESVIVFEPEYRNADALRGLEEYSHLWLLWYFSEFDRGEWSPTVRPPRLGGNKRMGVFATRSPNRPNPIGLSVVKIKKIELASDQGPRIIVSGADLLSGTPIFDIKPYLSYVDALPQASDGFAGQRMNYRLNVEIDPKLKDLLSAQEYSIVTQLLAQDPRPAYQKDANRVYAMTYGNKTIRFTVCEDKLTVVEIK